MTFTCQVYLQSYHQAVSRRLQAITDKQLEITDIYSLLDWLHNIYHRYTNTHLQQVRNTMEFKTFKTSMWGRGQVLPGF